MSSSNDADIVYRPLAFDNAPRATFEHASPLMPEVKSIERHVSAATAFAASSASRAPPRPLYLNPSHVESRLDAESLRAHVMACIRALNLDTDESHTTSLPPNPYIFNLVTYHEFAAVHVAVSIFSASTATATSASSNAHIVEIRLLRTCDGFAFSRVRDAILSTLHAAGATNTAKPAPNPQWAERNRAWKTATSTRSAVRSVAIAAAPALAPLALSPAEAFWQTPTPTPTPAPQTAPAALPVTQPVSAASLVSTPFPAAPNAYSTEPDTATATHASSDVIAAVTCLLRQASSEYDDVRTEAFRTLAFATCTCAGAELLTPSHANPHVDEVASTIASAGDSAASCLLSALTATHNADLCRCAAATIANLVRTQAGIAGTIARLGGAEVLARLMVDGVSVGATSSSSSSSATARGPRPNVQTLREVSRAPVHLHTQLSASGSHAMHADAQRHTAVADAMTSHPDSVVRAFGAQFRAMMVFAV
jgi:hypothetical protein